MNLKPSIHRGPALIICTGAGAEVADVRSSDAWPGGIELELVVVGVPTDEDVKRVLVLAEQLVASNYGPIGLAGASVGGQTALSAWEMVGVKGGWGCLLMLYGGVARQHLMPSALGGTTESLLLYLVGRQDWQHVTRGAALLGARAFAGRHGGFAPQWLRVHPGGHGTVLRGVRAQRDIRNFLGYALLGRPKPAWKVWP